jgi:hypothetical protein
MFALSSPPMRKLGIGLLVLFSVACGPKHDYPDSFKDSFMASCLETSGGRGLLSLRS